MVVFNVAYYKFNDEFSKFKMACRVRWTKGEKSSIFNTNWYLRFFGVADYKSAFIYSKFKIADLIWRKKNKNYPMLIKIRI